MLKLISQPSLVRESLTGLMRTWCVYRTSAKANGKTNGRFASLEPRQVHPDRGRGLWDRRL